MFADYTEDVEEWTQENFSGIYLGDKRLTSRVEKVAKAFAENPGKSIPQIFFSWSDIKAAYDLFSQENATPDKIQFVHREKVRESLEKHGETFLLIEDTTELCWSGNEPIEGLGPVGGSKDRKIGFLLHSVLSVCWKKENPFDIGNGTRRPPVEIIGIADQQYHIREPRSEEEKKSSDSKKGLLRPRESQLWENSSRRLGHCPEGCRWIRVSDRGSDIYEYLKSCEDFKHNYVVRSAQDRSLEDPETFRECGHLFEEVRKAEVLGKFELTIRSRPGIKSRVAKMKVAVKKVRLRSPQRPGKAAGSLPSITCSVVHAYEVDAPPDVKSPIEWFLLCSEEIISYEAALNCILIYTTRWLIEEFHKGLKTGMGAENLQLEQAHRLFAAISIMSIVALRLLYIKEWVRLIPDSDASNSGLSDVEIEVLGLVLKRQIKTVRDVALGIGRLGGHIGRRRDGMPGWETLWRGANKLQLLVEGYLLSKNKKT